MAEPERILELTRAVYDVANDKIRAIKKVTGTTRVLSLNALIEATRAGEAGKGFAVVANEVKNVSGTIDAITHSLENELSSTVEDLMRLGEVIVQQLRGSRLADLALNMIEIIDRNLYERSCDVRWWATDSAVVECLAHATPEAAAHATKRLGVILDSYTVYLDLWVADASGRVVATGRPDRYPHAVGANVANEAWFKDAMNTPDGTHFAMADIAPVRQLNNALVATYATAIRAGGEVNGRPLGVLGIFFDWQTQADRQRRVIASSDGQGVLTEVLNIDLSATMGSTMDAQGRIVGYALTPGYETYRGMGWYGVIIQQAF